MAALPSTPERASSGVSVQGKAMATNRHSAFDVQRPDPRQVQPVVENAPPGHFQVAAIDDRAGRLLFTSQSTNPSFIPGAKTSSTNERATRPHRSLHDAQPSSRTQATDSHDIRIWHG